MREISDPQGDGEDGAALVESEMLVHLLRECYDFTHHSMLQSQDYIVSLSPTSKLILQSTSTTSSGKTRSRSSKSMYNVSSQRQSNTYIPIMDIFNDNDDKVCLLWERDPRHVFFCNIYT